MRIALAVFADFEQTFLGGASQLLTPIGSRSVLGHTLARAARVSGADHRCLFVQPRDEAAARAALRDANLSGAFGLLALDDGQRPRRSLIRSARKWNLRAWRGSPLGTTYFDEYVEPRSAARVLDHFDCEAVLCVDGHQPAFDVGIAERMLAYQREAEDEASFVFTQAPPGLAGLLLRRNVTAEMIRVASPVGLLTAYRPEAPQMDLITKPMCCRIDGAVAQTPERFTGDTHASRAMLAEAFAALDEDCDAERLCTWVRQRDAIEELPREIEIELTTDDPLPTTTLRPRGERVPKRELSDIGAALRIARELAALDDRLLVLGGHGDPLAHPCFAEIVCGVREAGVCGLAVTTPLVHLDDSNLEALLAAAVDVVEVQIDAHSAGTYQRVHNADHFARVRENIARIDAERHKRNSPQPLVLCSLTRCEATLPEVEPFFDAWIREAGWVVVRGYSDFGGRLPTDGLLRSTPPVRQPCRRINSRLMLLANGDATFCDQDVAGEQSTGAWLSEPLSAIWRGELISQARTAHGRLDLSTLPLCKCCGEWFRP